MITLHGQAVTKDSIIVWKQGIESNNVPNSVDISQWGRSGLILLIHIGDLEVGVFFPPGGIRTGGRLLKAEREILWHGPDILGQEVQLPFEKKRDVIFAFGGGDVRAGIWNDRAVVDVGVREVSNYGAEEWEGGGLLAQKASEKAICFSLLARLLRRGRG